MKISKNKIVEISYQLKLDGFDGELVEEVKKNKPFTFLFGGGLMLESFEAHLFGLEKGDRFHFTLGYDDAYGKVYDENIVKLPKSTFETDGKLDREMIYEGAIIPMKDEKGNEYEGLISRIFDNEVMVDFNHPLAGEDLYFDGQIISIRDAEKEELEHGHFHNHNNNCCC
jgi:FKBP-type peptidyl-prolyl cis-trans isomerase SlyD